MSEVQKKHDSENISLTRQQEYQFKNALKLGIYKELYQKNLLSDVQLDERINNLR